MHIAWKPLIHCQIGKLVQRTTNLCATETKILLSEILLLSREKSDAAGKWDENQRILTDVIGEILLLFVQLKRFY